MHWFPFYTADFIASTLDCSYEETTAYAWALIVYYQSGGGLPADRQRLYRMLRCESIEQKQVVESVMRFFVERDGRIWHERCENEIAKQNKRSKEAAASANKRWGYERNANAMRTHSDGNANQNQNQNQIPEPDPELPKSNAKNPSASALPTPAVPQRPRRAAGEPPKSENAWLAYRDAHQDRYGVPPLRNAKVNSVLCRLSERVPADEIDAVVRFYLTHNKAIYVSARHCVDLLLRDAEGLRMEWATGRRGSQSEAKMADATQGRGNVWNKLIAEAERNERQ